jgi:hypothetical protein
MWLHGTAGLSAWYQQRGHWVGLAVFGASAVLATASLHYFGVQTHLPGNRPCILAVHLASWCHLLPLHAHALFR